MPTVSLVDSVATAAAATTAATPITIYISAAATAPAAAGVSQAAPATMSLYAAEPTAASASASAVAPVASAAASGKGKGKGRTKSQAPAPQPQTMTKKRKGNDRKPIPRTTDDPKLDERDDRNQTANDRALALAMAGGSGDDDDDNGAGSDVSNGAKRAVWAAPDSKASRRIRFGAKANRIVDVAFDASFGVKAFVDLLQAQMTANAIAQTKGMTLRAGIGPESTQHLAPGTNAETQFRDLWANPANQWSAMATGGCTRCWGFVTTQHSSGSRKCPWSVKTEPAATKADTKTASSAAVTRMKEYQSLFPQETAQVIGRAIVLEESVVWRDKPKSEILAEAARLLAVPARGNNNGSGSGSGGGINTQVLQHFLNELKRVAKEQHHEMMAAVGRSNQLLTQISGQLTAQTQYLSRATSASASASGASAAAVFGDGTTSAASVSSNPFADPPVGSSPFTTN